MVESDRAEGSMGCPYPPASDGTETADRLCKQEDGRTGDKISQDEMQCDPPCAGSHDEIDIGATMMF